MVKEVNGRYKVDIYPHGRKGKRIVRLFNSLDEALNFENEVKTKVNDGFIVSTDKQTLKELIDKWFLAHGQHLNSGKDRYLMMLNACEKMGNPLVNRFTKQSFLKYRNSRLGTVSNNTLNHELAYFRSLFSKLKEFDLYHFKNPLDGLPQLKVYEFELSFLTLDQVKILLDSLQPYNQGKSFLLAKICLSTGCRWSEAENLNMRSIFKTHFSFHATKNGKSRSVPVDLNLYSQVYEYLSSGKSLKGGYSTFKKVFNELPFDTPKGQMSHVLRHSFASHFIMNGGNILALQKLLGHSDIKITMRYSHLSPDYMSPAV